MPCNSDYLAPNHREQLLQETAQHLLYLRVSMGDDFISDNLRRSAKDIYCNTDYVAELCEAIRNLSEEDLNRVVYDGRNPQARKLADWWDKHQEADRKRIQQEQMEIEREQLKKSALAKLTAAERWALGR